MRGMQAASDWLFYDFCPDDHVPAEHQLRGIDRHHDLVSVRDVHERLFGAPELARPAQPRKMGAISSMKG